MTVIWSIIIKSDEKDFMLCFIFLLLLCEIHLFNYSRANEELAKLFCQRQCRKFCAKQQSEHHQHWEKSAMRRSKIKYAHFRYSSKAQSSFQNPFSSHTKEECEWVCLHMRIVMLTIYVEGCKSEKMWTDAWNLYAVSAKCETSITLLLSLTWSSSVIGMWNPQKENSHSRHWAIDKIYKK